MAVSRRSLLRNSIIAAIACFANPFKAWSATQANTTNTSGNSNVSNAGWQQLNRDAFTGAVGSSFQVTPSSGNGNSVWLTLQAVQDLPALVPVNESSMAVPPPAMSSTTTGGFMLSFLGTISTPLPQNTYTFAHPVLGTFSMLIVPDGQGQQTYTAVINQLN